MALAATPVSSQLAGQRHGLRCRYDDDGLRVIEVLDASAAAAHNSANPEVAIWPGDHVLAVNTHSLAPQMLRELASAASLELTLAREEDELGEPAPGSAPIADTGVERRGLGASAAEAGNRGFLEPERAPIPAPVVLESRDAERVARLAKTRGASAAEGAELAAQRQALAQLRPGVLAAMRRRYPGLHDPALAHLLHRMLRLRYSALPDEERFEALARIMAEDAAEFAAVTEPSGTPTAPLLKRLVQPDAAPSSTDKPSRKDRPSGTDRPSSKDSSIDVQPAAQRADAVVRLAGLRATSNAPLAPLNSEGLTSSSPLAPLNSEGLPVGQHAGRPSGQPAGKIAGQLARQLAGHPATRDRGPHRLAAIGATNGRSATRLQAAWRASRARARVAERRAFLFAPLTSKPRYSNAAPVREREIAAVVKLAFPRAPMTDLRRLLSDLAKLGAEEERAFAAVELAVCFELARRSQPAGTSAERAASGGAEGGLFLQLSNTTRIVKSLRERHPSAEDAELKELLVRSLGPRYPERSPHELREIAARMFGAVPRTAPLPHLALPRTPAATQAVTATWAVPAATDDQAIGRGATLALERLRATDAAVRVQSRVRARRAVRAASARKQDLAAATDRTAERTAAALRVQRLFRMARAARERFCQAVLARAVAPALLAAAAVELKPQIRREVWETYIPAPLRSARFDAALQVGAPLAKAATADRFDVAVGHALRLLPPDLRPPHEQIYESVPLLLPVRIPAPPRRPSPHSPLSYVHTSD